MQEKRAWTRWARWGAMMGLTVGSVAATSAGCLQREIEPVEPRTTSTIVERLTQSAVDKIDLLLVIDNSRSMADKQEILRLAVPDLVQQLVNPACVDEDGNVSGTQPTDPLAECDAGLEREFDPILDMHIGVITTSLGARGGRHGSAMKISLCNEVLAEYDFPRQCEIARHLGYDGIEMAPLTVLENPHVMPPAQRAELRRVAADAGVPITGLHYILRAPAGLSITSKDKAQRDKTIDVMKALCGLAADLGARTLVHGSPDQRRLVPGEEADGRKRAIECWAAMAPTSVPAPVATASPIALPETTIEPPKAMLRRSARGVASRSSADASFSTGSDSPVRSDSSARRP